MNTTTLNPSIVGAASAGRLLALAVLLAPALRAQAPEKPPPQEPPKLGLDDGGKEEMVELFHKVEKRLSEIDRLLYGASAGERALTAQSEAGIGDLLRNTSDKSQQVVRDIDRILEIASQNGGSCSSAMSGGQPKSGQGSPLDKQGDPQSARENTPDKPGAPKPEKPGGEKPEPADGGQPKSPRESNAEAQQRRGSPPDAGERAKNDAAQQTERWGDLPQHVRDLFRTEGGGDMPAQYRDWIDAYYRRLNQRP